MKQLVLSALVLGASAAAARAQFVVFEGDSTVESAWRAAASAGSIPLETFEGMHGAGFGGTGDLVAGLPILGLTFTSQGPGGYPAVYADGNFAHSGINQIANFNSGQGAFANFTIFPVPGHAITAFGFWQCDPQGNQTMYAYDADGHLIGTIVGHINDHSGHGFAGFVSSTPIASIVVSGAEGDGYNHMDDYQVVLSTPACPADLNRDGVVNTLDLAVLLGHFGNHVPNGLDLSGDINADGVINTVDLAYLLGRFGTSCP